MAPAPDDLIVAPATPPGRGALALVRLSGAGALDLASRLTGQRTWQPRRASRVRLALGDGLTEVAVLTPYPGPHSFTGQDLVEISTHGSPVIVDALLRTCVALGARTARPGEFTLRAHLNGRIDLVQAEAVADLVAATTAAQVRVASEHLEGTLSARIRTMGDGLAELRALLEASLDFPDEGFHFIEPEALASRIREWHRACQRLLGSADAGRRLHDGALVVIAGRPNAGKSSLFNTLLKRQRAIVTAVPGTTRDLLTEETSFGGVPVRLVDTAGLRTTGDVIEREGVSRAEQALDAADVVILVVDPQAGDDDVYESGDLWGRLADRHRICVLSKQDARGTISARARARWCPVDAVEISSTTGHGVADLEARLADLLGRASWDGETLTRARHRSLVTQCAGALERAADTAAGGGFEEYVLADLQEALTALEALRGVETADEVLQTIFSSFCIGK